MIKRIMGGKRMINKMIREIRRDIKNVIKKIRIMIMKGIYL